VCGLAFALSTSTFGNVNVSGNLTVNETLTVLGSINTTGNFTVDGNFTLGDQITFANGGIIDNVVTQWLRVFDSLNVTGNLSIHQNLTFKNPQSKIHIPDNNMRSFAIAEGSNTYIAFNTFNNAEGLIFGNYPSGGTIGLTSLNSTLFNLTSHNVYTSGNITANNVTALNLSGDLTWKFLDNYPSACSAGYAVTQIADSTTCSQFGVVENSNLNLTNTGVIYNRSYTYAHQFNVTTSNYIIGVNSSQTEVNVSIPSTEALMDGKYFIIKDEGGNASNHPIVVYGVGGELFDGEINYTITGDYDSIAIYAGGGDWWIN